MGTWEYDSFGQLKKSVTGGFCYTYEYHPDGKLLGKWNGGQRVLSCTCYRDGSLKSQTDAGGKTVYYAYDENGRLKYLWESAEGINSRDSEGIGDKIAVVGSMACGGTILTEYHYTDAGRIKEIITNNGIRTSYSYDEDGKISRLTLGDGTENGLLYDAFMLYDLNGNRTGKTGSRLDISGKQAEMAVSYRYDLLNRQIYVKTLDGKEQENFYDGEGLRAGVSANGKKTTFLYHNGEILAECGESGENMPVRRYVRGNRLSYVQTEDNVCHAFHQDEQGSTAYITG